MTLKPAIFSVVMTLAAMTGGFATTMSAQTIEATASRAGAYDALSDGDRAIVRAIYEAQFDSANDRAHGRLRTRDEIAVMRKNSSWDTLYRQLLKRGIVSPRSLGQAVSNHNRSTAAATGVVTIVTTAGGERIMVGGGRSNGGASGSASSPIRAGSGRSAVVQAGQGQSAPVGDAGASNTDAAAAISAGGASLTASNAALPGATQ